MSWLLTTNEFESARRALRASDITPSLYAWLARLVAVVGRSGTAAAPPTGSWIDADIVEEVLHEWLADKLLGGGLLQAFDHCESPQMLSRYLERAFRNWLISQYRGKAGPRLIERAVEIMNSEPDFALVRDSASVTERWWALAILDAPELYEGPDAYLVALAYSLGDFAIVRYTGTTRSDPVLSSSDLRDFLQGLLKSASSALSWRHFETVFRGRFAFAYAAGGTSLEDAVEVQANDVTDGDVAITQLARIAIGQLTKRQLVVLLRRPDGSAASLAAELEVSSSTIDNEYRRALNTLKELSDDEDFDALLEKVTDMALGKEQHG